MGSSIQHKIAIDEYAKKIVLNNKLKYDKNPKLCKQCLCPLPYEKKNTNTFCSSSCSAIYFHSNRTIKVIGNCLYCGNALTGRKTKKYCSNRCQRDYAFDQNLEEWISGKKNHKI